MTVLRAPWRDAAVQLHAGITNLRELSLQGVIRDLHDENTSKLRRADFARFQVVLGLVRGHSVLDVGTGTGAFAEAAARSGLTADGLDVKDYRHWQGTWSFDLGDATRMPYQDDTFTTVACLEVLEHLTDEQLADTIAECRRVGQRRVMYTTPLMEPWPPKTAGHRQQWTPNRLVDAFPDATFTVLHKGLETATWPWVLITE